MSYRIAFVLVAALFGVMAVGCGSGGNDPACLDKYGLVADGAACDPTGDSHAQCGNGASCTCSGSVSTTAFICFDSKCVTSIGNCDAWCAASESDRSACF